MPYPSLADLFWVLGYIPMGYGLVARIRAIPSKPTRRQNIIIWGSSAATILVTSFFVFKPIIQYFDAQRLLESILNFIYPLGDLFLAILVLRLFFSFEKGDYGFGWRLLAVGFILMTTSDFIFTYAIWEGTYYPDMKANLISRLFIDAPYTITYFLWFLGIYALRLLLREPQPVESVVQPRRVPPYRHIMISTRSDDTIFNTSSNSKLLFEEGSILGKGLAEALAISEKDGQAITEKLHKEGRVADLPIRVRNRAGDPQAVKLCGIVVLDPDSKYMGSNLLLRVPVDDNTSDDSLSQEARAMVGYLLEKSGSSYSVEIGNFLLEYHLAYFKEFFTLAFHEGGETMTRSLLEKFKETSLQHDWKLQFDLQTGLAKTIYPLEVLREALPALLQTVKQFVTRIKDPDTVETRMQEINMQFSEAIHKDATRYIKSGVEL